MDLENLPADTLIIARAGDLQALADRIADRLRDQSTVTLPEPSDNIELPEACAVLGKSKSWVYQNEDIIPHSRYRRKLIFSRSELTKWIAENTKRPVRLTDEVTGQLQKMAKKKKL